MLTTAERLRDVEGDLDQLLDAAMDTMSMAVERWSDGESACNICGYTITGGKQKLNQIYPHDPKCPIPALGAAVMQAHKAKGER